MPLQFVPAAAFGYIAAAPPDAELWGFVTLCSSILSASAEAADASLSYDREQKLPADGRSGIIEVWLVNLVEHTIEVSREPNYAGYGATMVFPGGDTVRAIAFPDPAVQVATLMG